MAFLLDSSILIDAKDDHYGFDFCPGYWDLIVRENAAGRVFSIEHVAQELRAGNDDLAEWAKARGKEFFLPMDASTFAELKRVNNYVQGLPATFTQTKKSVFLGGADPFLIACALAHGHTVVSREDMVSPASKNIKIPNICQNFGVPVVRACTMLRQLNARFVLET